jgi:hypothetical protein
MSKKVWKRNIPKPETRGQKNIPSFPRPVSNPVSKKCHSVSRFPERIGGNGFWEMRNRFPKIPFVSISVLSRSETKPGKFVEHEPLALEAPHEEPPPEQEPESRPKRQAPQDHSVRASDMDPLSGVAKPAEPPRLFYPFPAYARPPGCGARVGRR